MTAENVLSHLSHPLGLGQRDKSGFYGTANGTRAGQSFASWWDKIMKKRPFCPIWMRTCTIPKWSLLSHPLQ